MPEIKILNKQTLSNDQYLLQKVTFERPGLSGNTRRKEHEVYFRPDAIALLLVDERREKFLLTKQFRITAYLNGGNGYLTEVCAGLIDEGESPEQAAAREAQEEAGHIIKDLKKIGAMYTSVGGITEFVHYFTAFYSEDTKCGSGGGAADEAEDIELIELDFNTAKNSLLNGEINDAKTAVLLQHYFLDQY